MHNNGGITMVFMNSNDRAARDQLNKIGGIMSSSEELMNMAMPIVEKVMEPSPQDPQEFWGGGAVRLGQAALNYVPNLASNVIAKGLNPLLSKVKPGMTTPKDGIFSPKFEKFIGTEKFRRRNKPTIKADGTVDITKPAQAFKSDMLKKFGTLTAAKQALDDTLKDIEETDKNDDSKDKKDTRDKIEDVTDKSIQENYETSIGPVPKNMTVGELTTEFMRVAKNTAMADPGSFAERFGKAILLGLSTELATKYSKSTRSGTSPREDRSDAIRQFAEKLLSTNQFDNASDAMAEAKRLLKPLYPVGGGTPSDTTSPQPKNVITMYDSTGKPFYSTDGTNYVDADGNPYVPPTTT